MADGSGGAKAARGARVGPFLDHLTRLFAPAAPWDYLSSGSRVMVAVGAIPSRKVRAPQGRSPGNAWAPQGDGQGNREQTADGPQGIRQG